MYQIDFTPTETILELLSTAQINVQNNQTVFFDDKVRLQQVLDIFKEYQITYNLSYNLD